MHRRFHVVALALFAPLAATLVSACAAAQNEMAVLHFRVDANLAQKTSTLTCTSSTTNECVVWVGDPQSATHKSLRVAAGASIAFSGDDFTSRYCADTVDGHMAWPDCVTSLHGGALDKSNTVDFVSR